MKPRNLARLDLLAAEQAAGLLETLRHQNSMLAQSAQQRGVLAAYRARLLESWQNGAVVTAAQARRAGQFCTASETAEAQLASAESQAALSASEAMARLAAVQAQRRVLAEALARERRGLARLAERRAERDLQWGKEPERSRNGAESAWREER